MAGEFPTWGGFFNVSAGVLFCGVCLPRPDGRRGDPGGLVCRGGGGGSPGSGLFVALGRAGESIWLAVVLFPTWIITR